MSDGMRLLDPEKDALKVVADLETGPAVFWTPAKRLDVLKWGLEWSAIEHGAMGSYCSCS